MKLISTGRAGAAGAAPGGPGDGRQRGSSPSGRRPATPVAQDRTWSFRDALFRGPAPDGGLFVPARLPPLPPEDRVALADLPFPDRAHLVARHLLGDEVPDPVLGAVVRDALNFPVPMREIEPRVHLLELFHGPTHAFKDFGARFMARMMSALSGPPLRPGDDRPTASAGAPPFPATTPAPSRDHRPLAVLTATSGDTGGAVAHAFHGLPGVRVVVLYPLGRVSARQEAQFASLGGNVTAVAVRGAFDDCQCLARQAFADPDLNAALRLASANSINIGRLLPQTFYHVHALTEADKAVRGMLLAHRRRPRERDRVARPHWLVAPHIIVSVPSGNFGNLTAGLIARRILASARTRFVAATNANAVVPEYLASGNFRPRPSVPTLSSAMDVGDPGNFRRIVHLAGGDARLRELVSGSSWTDDQTRRCIRDLWQRRGIAIDPHTAVGLLGLRRELKRSPGACGVVLATAHPAKFAETVEPVIGEPLPVPPGIARVLDRPVRSVPIAPRLGDLRGVLAGRQLAGRWSVR